MCSHNCTNKTYSIQGFAGPDYCVFAWLGQFLFVLYGLPDVFP
jgi:hypothetical protein